MNFTEKNAEMRTQLRSLNAAIPDTAKAFGTLSKAAKSGEALDEKTKEFVALGIAVAIRCEPCVNFHIEALIRIGATRDEIAETLATCIQMGGGPSLMYAGKALACFDELSA